MVTQEQLEQLYNSSVVSGDGQTLGKVVHVYLDDHSQRPVWVTFRSGLLGLREYFAPLRGARLTEDMIQVRFTKDEILDAPRFGADGHLRDDEQEELLRYFRLDRTAAPPPDQPGPDPEPDPGLGRSAGEEQGHL